MIMNTLNQKDIRTLISEGNFDEVVNKYKKIIEIEPNNYKAHNNPIFSYGRRFNLFPYWW